MFVWHVRPKVILIRPLSLTSSSSAPPVSIEQLQADLACLTTMVSSMQSSSTASFGNFDAFSPPSSDEWYCGMTSLLAPLISDTTWVLDTGATEHMTLFNHRFVSYEKHASDRSVLTTSRGRLKVAGIGAIEVDGIGVVSHVLHVSSLRVVLMSPQRLIDDLSCSLLLRSDGMILTDKVGRITSIRRERGLLLLDDGGRSCLMVARGLTPIDEQWRGHLYLTHQRLGHPPLSILRHLFPSLFVGLDPETITCEACQLAKHRRASFTPSVTHTTTPLYRIHSDVW